MINVFQSTLGEQELAAVAEVFESGWLGRGPRTDRFVVEFAAHIGVDPEHLTPVNSCTEALFTAIELLGAAAGDEVVLPSISFVGAANAIAATGARPVFCDVDPHTLNPSVDHIAAKLTPRTLAVMVLHYGGYPGDLVEIAQLCRARGIPLIEDAACAIASTVDDRHCGTFGEFGAWSFDAMKTLVTGSGGMLYSRDLRMADRAARQTFLGLRETNASAARPWWEFDVEYFGRRSSINDIIAAIGSVQLRRLPDFISRRREVAEQYDRAFAGIDWLRLPPPLPVGHASSFHFYWVGLPTGIRDDVARTLYHDGVYTTFRYAPLHRLSAYECPDVLPGAERAAGETLCLPLHQGMDDAAVEKVVHSVRHAIHAAIEGPDHR